MEEVILVNERDEPVGTMEKIRAHREGLLHRAFSIIVLDDKGRILIQRRADEKYHSPGKWSNTCCSHPRPGELINRALSRKLQQEMGFECELVKIFEFIYRAELERGMIEHEYDHVYLGRYNGEVQPNSREVSEYRYLTIEELNEEIRHSPENYTPWFREIVPRLPRYIGTLERA